LYIPARASIVGAMPRRTAADRHVDTAPTDVDALGAESGAALLEALSAFHHPTRRWICELLAVEGPATVGQLARRTGLAVGSVSHHLGVLHRHGFAEPAPELARDTRESWWRSRPRRLSWDASDFVSGTVARRLAATAEAENFRHHVRAVQQWLATSQDAPEELRRAATATDTLEQATLEQMRDLGARLTEVVLTWSEECREDARSRPDAERYPVRVGTRVFPSAPVKP
jgi:DNA-binding transcriptional ArsR family regulator